MKKTRWITWLIVLLSAGAVQADDIYWIEGATGDWSNVVNWFGGIEPGTNDYARVNNGGLVQVTQSGEEASRAYFDSGSFEMSGGDLTIGQNIYFGYTAGTAVTNGIISGGTLAAVVLEAGVSGTGALSQSGGTVSVDSLYIGYNSGSEGTYSISGGTLDINGRLTSGRDSSVATFEVAGSSASIEVGRYLSYANSTLSSVLDAGGISLIDVVASDTGTALLDGTWTVTGSGAVPGTYNVLTATNGISGTFDAVSIPVGWSWGIDDTATVDTLWVTVVDLPDPDVFIEEHTGLTITNLVGNGTYSVQSRQSTGDPWTEEDTFTATNSTMVWVDPNNPPKNYYQVVPVQ